MLCRVFAFRYLLPLQYEYAAMLLLCSRCEKVVILNVFEKGINAVLFLPVFQAVYLVFLTAQWRRWHTGAARVFNYDSCLRTRACLFCIFVPPTKGRSHFTKLLTRALFFVPCQFSYIFVSCPAFHVHVAGDSKKTISLVAGVLSISFARALLVLIHQSTSCRAMQLNILKT